ncbi:MAG: restriction endonuclease subunit S [Candidatus Omnitrophota bacterium]|jgi:hypothetical protein
MTLLSKLFKLKNGITKSSVRVYSEKASNDYVKFIRPSKSYRGTFDGFVKKTEVPKDKVFPSETIFVSTDGQGSHSYAYVSAFEFVPNSNVVALIPKHKINLIQKHYYARCISANRYKFSYGRKPKGDRLENISLPSKEEIPQWALNYKYSLNKITERKKGKFLKIETKKWKWFTYDYLFIPQRGKVNNISKNINSEKTFPLISATTKNNGVVGYLDINTNDKFPPNCITIANTGQGSVGFPAFQEKEFYATNNITVLKPKFKCNKYVGLFLCTLMKKERFKYSYGRVINEKRIKEARLKLPIDKKGNPDWQFMDKYVRHLKLSAYV